MRTYIVRDPFAGDIEVSGETLSDAIEEAYSDVPQEERPEYVWHGDERVDVPGGTCRPTC